MFLESKTLDSLSRRHFIILLRTTGAVTARDVLSYVAGPPHRHRRQCVEDVPDSLTSFGWRADHCSSAGFGAWHHFHSIVAICP